MQQQQQQQQQLQNLMQMHQQQPIMSSSAYYPNNVTTDHIQQYLDENKSLILKIVESQNSGKMSECAENQARLQRNLMYLAAIADSQHQPPALQAQSGIIQPGSLDMQHPQAQQMPPQSLTVARSSMLYNSQQQQQQPYSTLQQHQSVHNQLSMNSGFHMLQGNNASSNTHMYSVFGHESGGGEGQHSGVSHNSDGN